MGNVTQFNYSSVGNHPKVQIAFFAAGCFWGVEAAYRNVPGVVNTTVGFMGGTTVNPSYADVCTDKTGHAEVTKVEFDTAVITYKQLLKIFWDIHDPTTLNRQGNDIGTQYRSVIFYLDKRQQRTAVSSKEKLEKSGKYNVTIVTEITPASPFYKASEHHQRYLEKRGRKGCDITQ